MSQWCLHVATIMLRIFRMLAEIYSGSNQHATYYCVNNLDCMNPYVCPANILQLILSTPLES